MWAASCCPASPSPSVSFSVSSRFRSPSAGPLSTMLNSKQNIRYGMEFRIKFKRQLNYIFHSRLVYCLLPVLVQNNCQVVTMDFANMQTYHRAAQNSGKILINNNIESFFPIFFSFFFRCCCCWFTFPVNVSVNNERKVDFILCNKVVHTYFGKHMLMEWIIRSSFRFEAFDLPLFPVDSALCVCGIFFIFLRQRVFTHPHNVPDSQHSRSMDANMTICVYSCDTNHTESITFWCCSVASANIFAMCAPYVCALHCVM